MNAETIKKAERRPSEIGVLDGLGSTRPLPHLQGSGTFILTENYTDLKRYLYAS